MEAEKNTAAPGEQLPAPASRPKKSLEVWITLAVYILAFTAFGIGLGYGLNRLEGWLTDYEAAQPETKCRLVFEELFADPDWEQLYTMAGAEDTVYENASHYAAYMREKVGEGVLTYSETSAGLSGDHKYIVKLGNEKIAEFTLTAAKHTVTDIPDWKLGTVNVFFTRQQSVRICTDPENTVLVNGVALTQSHITKTLHTQLADCIPEGIRGLQRKWMYEGGFLVPPQVTVETPAGETVALVYDESTHTYTQPLPEESMSREQEDFVLEAAKTYCRYMARHADDAALRRYFDRNSEIFRIITDAEIWMLSYREYRFGEHTFTDYHRYGDTLYSVKVSMSFFGTGRKGVEIEFPVNSTFLVQKQENGNWLVVDIVNLDLQKQTVQVRMRYMQNGQIIEDQMVDATATALVPPTVTAPEGQRFAGWYLLQKDEKGNSTYQLAFLPDENGNVYLSQEVGQEEMTLHALFETDD